MRQADSGMPQKVRAAEGCVQQIRNEGEDKAEGTKVRTAGSVAALCPSSFLILTPCARAQLGGKSFHLTQNYEDFIFAPIGV